MARLSPPLLTLAGVAALAGCATALPAPETPAEALARRSAGCREAGFAPDTPDLRLCLLLERANERLDALERRLAFIEQDVRLDRARPYPYWW